MSDARCAIAVFARAPRPGRVKTRLAPAIGQRGAAALHRRLVRRTVRTAVAAGIGPVTLYCTPDARDALFVACRREWGVGLARQRGTGLGERMFRALREQSRGDRPALLVGSDCPGLDAAYLGWALAALEAGCDTVLGPSTDGGYVLIGTRRPRPALFRGVPWGETTVLQRTRRRLERARAPYRLLPAQPDIDTPADLRGARRAGVVTY
ncbi:MAG TPA: TIGR04282 family arsenosugar biosynthesis glycosyltransferase [Gammaproteobacteria bacterium]|nr:TIGR04282 family arsenosugar biosynthesis glycosyltransferase [Gammaproteobacteria bacterium]